MSGRGLASLEVGTVEKSSLVKVVGEGGRTGEGEVGVWVVPLTSLIGEDGIGGTWAGEEYSVLEEADLSCLGFSSVMRSRVLAVKNSGGRQ